MAIETNAVRFVRVAMLSSMMVVSWPAQATTYLFATFKGDTEPQERLSIYTSADALNFTLLSDTGFEGSSSTLRDPSIMRYSDGMYYLAYTDPPTATCCGPEDHFTIATSTDLVHWQDLTVVRAGVPGASHTWAPEWLVGDDVERLIANIDTANTDSDFKPYIFTPLNSALTSWSGPTAMGIGPNYIDTCVVKAAGTYHAFTKNETTRFLEHATAAALTGPWTFVGKGDWAGLGAGGFEGPTVVEMDNGRWRMYLDPQRAGVPCTYMDSADLNNWSAPALLPGDAGVVVRHGTVIRDEARAPPTGTGGSPFADGGGNVADAAADIAATPDAIPEGTPDGRTGGSAGSGGSSGSGGTLGSGSTLGSGGSTRTETDASPSAGGSSPSSGCGCQVTQSASGIVPPGLGVTLVLALRRRRRGRERRVGASVLPRGSV